MQVDLVNNTNTNMPANCQGITEEVNTLDVNEIQNLCDKLRSCSLSTKLDEVEQDDEDTGLYLVVFLCILWICVCVCVRVISYKFFMSYHILYININMQFNFVDDSVYLTPPSTPEFVYNDSDDDMENAEEEGPIIFIEG